MLRTRTAGTCGSGRAGTYTRLCHQRLPRANRALIQRPARNRSRGCFWNAGTRRSRHGRHRGFRTGRQFGRQIRTRRHYRSNRRLSCKRTALLRRHRRGCRPWSFRPPRRCRWARCSGAGSRPAFGRRCREWLSRTRKNLTRPGRSRGPGNWTRRCPCAWNRWTAGRNDCCWRHRPPRRGRRRRRCWDRQMRRRRCRRARPFGNRTNRSAANRRVNRSPCKRRTNRCGMGGRRRFRSLLGLCGRLRFRTYWRRPLRWLRLHGRNSRTFRRRRFRLFQFGDRYGALRLRFFLGVTGGARRRLRHIEAIHPAQLHRHVIIHGAGVTGLLSADLGNPQLREPVQELPGLHFQLPRQLVDTNLAHR